MNQGELMEEEKLRELGESMEQGSQREAEGVRRNQENIVKRCNGIYE